MPKPTSRAKSRSVRKSATQVKTRARHAPRPGQKCSKCHQGVLDYDGLLNLSCTKCGDLADAGGFT